MIEYNGQINLPNASFGVTERTITVNESVRTCDLQALAREISHQNRLIPEDVAQQVLAYFCKAAAAKMTEGFAIQLSNGDDVAIRIFPDVHVKGGNINLKRAKELMPGVVTDEETMVAHAGELIDKAGVKVSVKAVAQNKFSELLEKSEFKVSRKGIVTKSFEKQQQEAAEPGGSDNQGDNTGSGDSGYE